MVVSQFFSTPTIVPPHPINVCVCVCTVTMTVGQLPYLAWLPFCLPLERGERRGIQVGWRDGDMVRTGFWFPGLQRDAPFHPSPGEECYSRLHTLTSPCCLETFLPKINHLLGDSDTWKISSHLHAPYSPGSGH